MTGKLALNGGAPLRSEAWPTWPLAPSEAGKRLSQVLESKRWTVRGWFTGTTPNDQLFAEAFARFHDVPHCVTAASGSAALAMALDGLDIGFGDEVIVPIQTWMAPAIAVVQANAVPVFVDLDPDTLCMSPAAVQAAITPRTRAILIVHQHCTVADLDALLDIASRHDLRVIEDASQAHGAIWRGRRVGSWGDVGVFSMNQEKVLPAGEGGAAITSDPALHRRMEQVHGDGCLFDGSCRTPFDYQCTEPGEVMGSNLCPSEFQTAMMLLGLGELDRLNAVRRDNAQVLDRLLSDIPGLSPLRQDSRIDAPTYFKYAIRVDRRHFADRPLSVLCKAVGAELGLPVYPPDPPLHLNPLYRPLGKRRHRLGADYEKNLDMTGLSFPVAEAAVEATFTFHHRALLGTERDVEDIAAAFDKVRRHAAELPRQQDTSGGGA